MPSLAAKRQGRRAPNNRNDRACAMHGSIQVLADAGYDRPKLDMARPAHTDASEELLEAMPDAIVMVGRDGRVVRVNKRAESLSGYSRRELVGMAVEELVPEMLRSAHVAHRAAYQRRPTVRSMGTHLDIRFRRKDGSEFPADIALSPVMTEQVAVVVASVRDITDRKRADEELLQAQERFRLVVEGVHDYAIFMLDREGHVSTWSPAAARIKGYEADEVLSRHFSVFYPKADVDAGKPERELATAAEAGRYEEEGWRVRKDGSLLLGQRRNHRDPRPRGQTARVWQDHQGHHRAQAPGRPNPGRAGGGAGDTRRARRGGTASAHRREGAGPGGG